MSGRLVATVTLLACILVLGAGRRTAEPAQPASVLAAGLNHPTAVAVGPDGRVVVAVRSANGEGALVALRDGPSQPFAQGLDPVTALGVHQDTLYALAQARLWRIDRTGKAEVFVDGDSFPSKSVSLTALAVDQESGLLYVADAGDEAGRGAAVYRIDPRGRKAAVVTDATRLPGLRQPGGLVMDGASFLLLADSAAGVIYRVNVADGSANPVAEGLEHPGALVWDKFGRLFIRNRKSGRLAGLPRPGTKPVPLDAAQHAGGDPCVDAAGHDLLIPDAQAGTVTRLRPAIPGWEVDESPLPLTTAPAFPDLQWTGWQRADDSGKVVPHRPILLTHAGDGTGRIFVGIQQGVVHVFPKARARATRVFLDLTARVRYSDRENEEGFLGLAFHPDFARNGEFFVFYTDKRQRLTNVVSRFRVSRDDPDRADPESEEILLQIKKPFWNHDGGTICFGPDGYLYVTHGDGGLANDPYGNGQKLSTLLGKVLRIDVNRKENGKGYAAPPDNPFVGREGAAPEVWAYGLRNIWRMAFDRETGRLWAGEVGQNLYEEINLITRGGNYGWNLREAFHPFGRKGVGPRDDLIDPIWEYHHDVGKSITGGLVYRGKRLPELAGAYVYGDYVSGKIWALWYDEAKRRVTANRLVRDSGFPVFSFGEDQDGELYLLTETATGLGVYRFERPPSRTKSD